MKKMLVMMLFLVIVLASCSLQNQKVSKNTKIAKNISTQADYEIPKDFDDLVANSKDIVKVKFIKNKDIGDNGSTTSEVEILKAYKGDLKKADTIDISEPWHLTNNKYTAVENYIAMEEGQTYTLFLSDAVDKVRPLVSMGYGKFSETLKEKQGFIQEYNLLGQIQKYDFLGGIDDELKTYQQIKKQVFEKYK